MSDGLIAAGLLVVSNTFMTSAYQLKVMQEAITLVAFVLFAAVWLGDGLTPR